MTIQLLERWEIKLLVLKQMVIWNLLSGLFAIELVLEDMDFVVKGYQLIVERGTVVLFRLWWDTIFVRCSFITALSLNSLGSCLNCGNVARSRFCIEVSCHEVLICMQIFVQVHNVVNGNFVRTTSSSIVYKLASLLLFTSARLIWASLF